MGNTVKGGANWLSVFALTSSGGEWAFGTELLKNQQVIKTDFTGHIKKKNLVIKPQTDYAGAEIDSLFNSYLVEAATTSNEVYEDGSPRSENAGNHEKLVGVLVLGGKSSDGKRKVTTIVAEVDGGDYSQEANANVETAISFKSVRADLVTKVPQAKLPSSYLSALATLTIPKDAFGLVTNMTSA